MYWNALLASSHSFLVFLFSVSLSETLLKLYILHFLFLFQLPLFPITLFLFIDSLLTYYISYLTFCHWEFAFTPPSRTNVCLSLLCWEHICVWLRKILPLLYLTSVSKEDAWILPNISNQHQQPTSYCSGFSCCCCCYKFEVAHITGKTAGKCTPIFLS